jgi:hypothetical protein
MRAQTARDLEPKEATFLREAPPLALPALPRSDERNRGAIGSGDEKNWALLSSPAQKPAQTPVLDFLAI